MNSENLRELQEFAVLERIKHIFPSIDLIVDVGAAIGSWSKTSKEVWPQVNVVAIEPQDEFVEILKNSGCVEKVYQCVISETCGQVDFNISSDKWSSSMLYAGERTVTTPSRTLECVLDSYDRNFKCAFVKTDLQGMDLVAFKSLGRYMAHVAGVQMECQLAEYAKGMTGLSERIMEMSRFGFEVYEILNPLTRPSDGALGQVDIVFLKRDTGVFSNFIW